eukprot:jgi/Psemu1/243571/estExt_Genewise1.C_3630019
MGSNTRHSALGSGSRKTRPEPLVLDPSATASRSPARTFNGESHGRVSLSSFASSTSLGDNGGNNGKSNSNSTSHRDGGSSSSSKIKSSTVQKFFRVATKGIRDHHAAAAIGGGYYLHATPAAVDGHGTNGSSAAVFARSGGVVQAGFLQKLGKNIPEFKRRFFVLKPETNLYYYLSPNETEPRGKIDLEGASIESLETTPNGTLRFVVSLPNEGGNLSNSSGTPGESNHEWNDNDDNVFNSNSNTGSNNNNNDNFRNQQIVLEARSKEIGEEWIRHMKGERVSFLKDKVDALTGKGQEQAIKIADLERQIEHFRMIEADRDGALEDAQNWKNKFNRLDEALRLLTQQIRKSLTTPLSPKEQKPVSNDENKNVQEIGLDSQTIEDERKKDDVDPDQDGNHDSGVADAPSNDKHQQNISGVSDEKTPAKDKLAPALLDDLTQDDMKVEEILDVPGTYFSGLSNAFQQQKEASRLASIEASTAVDDVFKANEQVEAIQKRMKKAEKQILNLWEENCTIRKTLKQKKRERRVLVREVKQLQETVKTLEENSQNLSKSALDLKNVPEEDNHVPMADSMIGSDEERLIIELEEHVASSIRLHERLLAGSEFDRDMEQSISTNPVSVTVDTVDSLRNVGSSGFERGEIEISQPKLLSLLDDESDSDDESSCNQEGSNDHDSRRELRSIMGSVASATDNTAISDVGYVQSIGTAGDGDESYSQRLNPLLKLDHNDDDELTGHQKGDAHSFKSSSSKLVTENGQATSRLVCPLADVVDTRRGSSSTIGGNQAPGEANEDLRVHHLTFYSQKIGLQFQKASPAPLKSRGLLTDALMADLVRDVDGSDKTAAELRSVASIASLAKGGTNAQGKEITCPLALPDDIVLVCGFEGFDDSGANQRPKLGARLVAFDGVSVEVGKWTFENISKAIKSRGRPLTLSFRNDFLTTEQRAILTKAIKDVDAKRDPVRSVIQYERPQSTTPSLNSALSYESGHFVNNDNAQGSHHSNSHNEGTGLDISMAAAEESNCWHRFPVSSNSSLSSVYKDANSGRILPHPPSSSSVSTHTSRKSLTNTAKKFIYSFNEAGSSNASNEVSPMMSNVGEKVSSSSERQQRSEIFRKKHNNEKGGSERSRRFGIGINPSGTQQHQDFQSNLL